MLTQKNRMLAFSPNKVAPKLIDPIKNVLYRGGGNHFSKLKYSFATEPSHKS